MTGLLRLLLIFGFFNFSVAQGSCDRPLELDRRGFSMEHVPVLDQDGLKMCRVYTAIQMADAWRFSHGDRNYSRRTSPLATGLRQSKYDWYDNETGHDNYGGYHCDIVNFMRTNGGCAMNASVESLGGKSPKETLAYLAQFFERKSDRLAKSRQLHCELPKLGMPAGFLPSVERIAALLEGDRDDFIRGVLTNRCEGANRIRIPAAPWCMTLMAKIMTDAQKAAFINSSLDRPNPQPINISYCSNILTGGRAYRAPFFPAAGKTCRYHSSLIIGRRKNANTGKCEFKVRNTWGTSCRGYSSDWTCQGGNIWIDAEKLAQSTGGIQTWSR